MNKHIELVKKWLVDPSSVSSEELKVNVDASGLTFKAAFAATYVGTKMMNDAAVDDAAYWVKRYEELIGDSDE